METLIILGTLAAAGVLWLLFRDPSPKTPTRSQELAELEARYDRLLGRTPFTPEHRDLILALFRAHDPRIVEPVRKAVEALVASEQFLGNRPDFAALDLKQQVELSAKLRSVELRLEDGGTAAGDLITGIFTSIAEELPATQTPSPFTVPLINTLKDPKLWITRLTKTLLAEEYRKRDLLGNLREQLILNLCLVSGINPNEPSKKPYRFAVDSDLPLTDLNDAYLRRTPLHDLFNAPVPLRFTRDDRMNHTHIIGGTGAGKTTLIEHLILNDLTSDDPPSLVIIDPHSDLIRKLTRANLGIADRVIIIDPRDLAFPPLLNVFAVNRERLGSYDAVTREQVTAGVIQTFDYLFGGLVGADLTAKQGVFFRYVARLMLMLPETHGRNATILDMLRLMTDDAPYREAIEQLPEIPREFFLRDFNSKTFQQTKEQIRYRLQAILENPTMARLFTSPETKVDLFTELNRGGVILVDTAKDFLKGASGNFGRIFISLVLQAVLERAAIPAQNRKDTFLIVDEAASYFDSNIDDLLTEARKYRCGLVLAHQYLDQATSSLRASLAANTGIKFASGLSMGDARALAPDMRTTADFILAQPKLQFAAFIKGVTAHAVSVPVTPGVLDRHPKLYEEDHALLLERNAIRVGLPDQAVTAAQEAPSPESPLPPPEDISREW